MLSLNAWERRAASPNSLGGARDAAYLEWCEWLVSDPHRFFRAIDLEVFVLGCQINVAPAGDLCAQVIALDRRGRAVIVVCPDGHEPLETPIKCASFVAQWEAKDFFGVLNQREQERLRAFLGDSLKGLNFQQRVYVLSQEWNSDLLAAAKWLSRNGRVDLSAVQVRLKGRRLRLGDPLGRLLTGSAFQADSELQPDIVIDAVPGGEGAIGVRPPAVVSLGAGDRLRRPRRVTRAGAMAAAASLTLGIASLSVTERVVESTVDISSPPVAQTPAPPRRIGLSIEDARTHRPVKGAKVCYGGHQMVAGPDGELEILSRDGEETVFVKAPGYEQAQFSVDNAPALLRLEPLAVQALYLSQKSLSGENSQNRILNLLRNTSANAVVVGVKEATGSLAMAVEGEAALLVGAQDQAPGIDLVALVADWKAQEIYTIALIALFKDGLVHAKLPQLALRSIVTRQVIRDRLGYPWIDPSSAVVQQYSVEVARAAAAAGFDEVHFDFVRYPAEELSRQGAGPAERRRRQQVITHFLRRAYAALIPYNVYVSASVFGLVCTVEGPTVIGQNLEEFASAVDYVSPMLYPSYFGRTETERKPPEHAYHVVRQSLLTATARLDGNSRRIRPWLQAFSDPLSREHRITAAEIRAQVTAAQTSGVSGWMMWDFANRYPNMRLALRNLPEPRRQEAIVEGERRLYVD